MHSFQQKGNFLFLFLKVRKWWDFCAFLHISFKSMLVLVSLFMANFHILATSKIETWIFCYKFLISSEIFCQIFEKMFFGEIFARFWLSLKKELGVVEIYLNSPCLHHAFGPAFTPYPLFQWYLQSKEILLKNSAFNAQASETNYNYSSCTGRSSENICSSSGGAQEKGKIGWNSIYHQNRWKN